MMKYKLTIIFSLIFVLPPLLYIVVNFYWWLFDGNVLIADKMAGAAGFGTISLAIAIGIYLKEDGQL